MKIKTILVALAMGLTLASCTNNEEVAYVSLLDTKADFFVDQADDARGLMLQDIRSAKGDMEVAISELNDLDLANAIVTAHKAGANVRVVADVDRRSDPGFAILEGAGIDVVYGDGELRYLPDPTLSPSLDDCGMHSSRLKVTCPSSSDRFDPPSNGTMVRPGEFNTMSYNFVLIGKRIVWNFSHQGETAVAFRVDSETMRESFWREFNQMHGGVFSTTLSVYSGPIKSTTQYSPNYLTEHGEMRMHFGPQERVVKHILDDVYKSRANIWIMADSISEEFFVKALEYKKTMANMNVRLVVRDAGQDTDLRPRLENIGLKVVDNVDYLPTMIIIDHLENRLGVREIARAHVATMPLLRTTPSTIFVVEPNDKVEVYPSDLFVDGMTWSVVAYSEQENEVLDDLVAFYEKTYAGAREAQP